LHFWKTIGVSDQKTREEARKMTNMTRRVFATMAMALAATLASSSPAAAKRAVKQGAKVPSFTLKDSKGKTYTLKSFKEPVLVFWYEGKNSKEQNRWIKKKLKKLVKEGKLSEKKYRSVGIANFQETAVPNFLVNAVIKSEIKKTGAVILCDRNGKMMKKWGFRNGRSNIYVLDKKRRLRWRSSGSLSKRRGNQLIRFILRLTKQY
jgi:predicted transcriptional regulator